MQIIFLDTNIFIHFIDFDQINWNEVLSTKEKIKIAFAPIVIDELDKHKYHKSSKISNRVKKLLPKIENLIDNSLDEKYEIIYINNRPKENTFIANSLDRKEQDDCLLATIIDFQEGLEKGDLTTLITNDVGPRLKAKNLGISTKKLSEDYSRPMEIDETEVKNTALQKELNELKNKQPKVSISFENLNDFYLFKKEKLNLDKERYIQKQLLKIKVEIPLIKNDLEERDLYINPMYAFRKNLPFAISDGQIKIYNEELEEYYSDCESYYSDYYEFLENENNIVPIQLILRNQGTTPAEDIDIELHFPDGFRLCLGKDKNKAPKMPNPPYKPKHSFDIGSFKTDISSLISPIVSRANTVNHPKIKQTNSYEVTYNLKYLKHNQDFNFETLYAMYDDIKLAIGFTIDYKLKIGNVTKLIEGKLQFNFE